MVGLRFRVFCFGQLETLAIQMDLNMSKDMRDSSPRSNCQILSVRQRRSKVSCRCLMHCCWGSRHSNWEGRRSTDYGYINYLHRRSRYIPWHSNRLLYCKKPFNKSHEENTGNNTAFLAPLFTVSISKAAARPQMCRVLLLDCGEGIAYENMIKECKGQSNTYLL